MTPKQYKQARAARLHSLSVREKKYARKRKSRKEINRKRRSIRRKQQKAVVMMATRALPPIRINRHRENLCERLRELNLTKRGLVEALMALANEARDIQDQLRKADEAELRDLATLDEKSLAREPVRLPLKKQAA